MSTEKFRSLKDQLRNLEKQEFGDRTVRPGDSQRSLKTSNSFSGWYRYVLLGSFLVVFLFYLERSYDFTVVTANPVDYLVEWVNQPDEDLLQEMGARMETMGYADLTREDLIDLRSEGVTATFTSRMRDLGYTGLTLEELVRLRQNDVSDTFSAMMNELGYELSVEDLIQLRQHEVTAYYTSNMHDLGYQDITKEELIRLKDTGVSTSDVERLIEDRDTQPTLEEIIRYHISNQ